VFHSSLGITLFLTGRKKATKYWTNISYNHIFKKNPFKNTSLKNQINMICMYAMMVCITITILIHCPVLYLKHYISETGFCLRLQKAGWFANFWKRLSISLVSLFDIAFLKWYDWIQSYPFKKATLKKQIKKMVSFSEDQQTSQLPEDRDSIWSPKHRILNKR
jgi:hypothetical protein